MSAKKLCEEGEEGERTLSCKGRQTGGELARPGDLLEIEQGHFGQSKVERCVIG